MGCNAPFFPSESSQTSAAGFYEPAEPLVHHFMHFLFVWLMAESSSFSIALKDIYHKFKMSWKCTLDRKVNEHPLRFLCIPISLMRALRENASCHFKSYKNWIFLGFIQSSRPHCFLKGAKCKFSLPLNMVSSWERVAALVLIMAACQEIQPSLHLQGKSSEDALGAALLRHPLMSDRRQTGRSGLSLSLLQEGTGWG